MLGLPRSLPARLGPAQARCLTDPAGESAPFLATSASIFVPRTRQTDDVTLASACGARLASAHTARVAAGRVPPYRIAVTHGCRVAQRECSHVPVFLRRRRTSGLRTLDNTDTPMASVASLRGRARPQHSRRAAGDRACDGGAASGEHTAAAAVVATHHRLMLNNTPTKKGTP